MFRATWNQRLSNHYPTKLSVRMKTNHYFLTIIFLLLLWIPATAQKKKSPPAAIKPPIDSVKTAQDSLVTKLKGSTKTPGLFTFYQDTLSGSMLLYIRKDQLGKEFIYQSFSMGGPAELFLNQNMIRDTWVFKIQKNFNKVEFARVNTNFYYDPQSSISKAANVDAPEAMFFNNAIAHKDSNGYYIKADELFLSEKLDRIKPSFPSTISPDKYFNLGELSASKSSYQKIRSFPKNTDVVVELVYDNPKPAHEGGRDIADARFVKVKMQHSFLEMPANDYVPRRDDPRVGYFLTEVNDMTTNKFLNYRDFIHRWHLKKQNPGAEVSEPVEPIVWWVENTTPPELREIILNAGRKWNEAFEKAGFRNAVIMKMMPDTATWDPADIRYNVIRFVSSNLGYAIGPSFVNPRTGQILGADITIDYGLIVGGLEEQALFEGFNGAKRAGATGYPPKHQFMNCNISQGLKAEFALANVVLDGEAPAEKDSLFNHFLTMLVLHEMGHTMGLNHNMKASHMLSPAELTNKEITGARGVMGSVMDYDAVNISPDRTRQAHYYTTRTGPYDAWAIEYGYRPFATDEEQGLKKILSRSTEPQLLFGNDADDMRTPGNGIDPRVMVWDMSNDMVTFATDRLTLINGMVAKLRDRMANKDQSYQELVSKYGALAYQRYSMTTSLSRYIGGVYVDRSYGTQNSKEKPYTPVSENYQRKALQVIGTHLLSPKAFEADAYLFPYLQRQRRGFNFFGSPEDPKPEGRALMLQSNVLDYLLFPETLKRINSTTLYGNTYSVASLLNDLSGMVFDEDLKTEVHLIRQNVQTALLTRLIGIQSGDAYDPASKAAAYSALVSVKKKLKKASSPDEQTRSHRAYLDYLIDNALAVK